MTLPPGFNESVCTDIWIQRHDGHKTHKEHHDIGEMRQWWLRCNKCGEGHLFKVEPKPSDLKQARSMSLAEVVAEMDGIASLGDLVYKVRDRAIEKAYPFEGSSWELPEVKRYGELHERMRALLQREKHEIICPQCGISYCHKCEHWRGTNHTNPDNDPELCDACHRIV